MLLAVISLFPTGCMVRIAESSSKVLEGAEGAVMKPNSGKPHHPILVLLKNARGARITPKTLDLAEESRIRLELIV